jgi:hypothetical protein
MKLLNFFSSTVPRTPPNNKMSKQNLAYVEEVRKKNIQLQNKKYRQERARKEIQKEQQRANRQRQQLQMEKIKSYERNWMYEEYKVFFDSIIKQLRNISNKYTKLLNEEKEKKRGFSKTFSTKKSKKYDTIHTIHNQRILNFQTNFKSIIESILDTHYNVKQQRKFGEERKRQFLEVVVYKIIFKNMDRWDNDVKSLLGPIQKSKLNKDLSKILNIYSDYPLLCYLIEKDKIKIFVTNTKVFYKFFKIVQPTLNTILITDASNNSYYLHKNFLHPKLYKYFLELIPNQQKKIQIQIRNQLVPEQKVMKVRNKKALKLLGFDPHSSSHPQL